MSVPTSPAPPPPVSAPRASIPRVAIVGRPNVGKSSLFNWLAGERLSIVDPTAGVTRDRLTHLMHEGDRYFELIDTGGIGIVDSDALEEEIEGQIRVGLEMADVLLFVGDGQTGVLPLDREVARRLHPLGKPVVIAVNKCDSPKTESEAAEFLSLFDAPLVPTTVKGNRGRPELIAALLAALPPAGESEASGGAELATDPVMKLAVVGRRNVGKSTFLNALAGEERVIVSEVAGTTRDSIDLRFEVDGRALVAIDTPGVRRKKSLANDVEYYGTVRAQQSIRRADVVLMTFDATRTISKVDKQLVADIVEAHKPCIFVVNKWDLALEAEMTSERWAEYLEKTFANMRFVPVAFLTSQAGRNVRPVVDLAQSLFRQARERAGTGKVNAVVRAAFDRNPPPVKKNRRPKIFFATQVAVTPPTIVLKCNEPALFGEDWKRYLLTQLRENLPYPEIPIRLYFRPRGKEEPAAGGGRPPVKSRRPQASGRA